MHGAEKIGAQTGLNVDLLVLLPNREEDLLHDFFGIGGVMQIAEGKATEPGVVGTEYRFQRLSVTFTQAGEQSRFVDHEGSISSRTI
jgi:hypothetical protein